ncbi:MAG: nucleoside deaminase [Alphaproteobacteria bacterium]|nr:nucleoside deaminase [Alphaproteobacteria bacterium]
MTNSPFSLALEQARLAAACGEVPVGAVVVNAAGVILARAHNLTETDKDPCAHAEILAIRAACKELDDERLTGCDLYVTLEPCPMCAQAISFARIRRVYFGAYDVKGGGVENGARIFAQSSCHHTPEVYGGMHESECSALLKDFFKARR